MSKLTNRDIERIIKQWLKGKSVVEIARYFQVTRKRIYQIIKAFNEIYEPPIPERPGRRFQFIDQTTVKLILELYRANPLSPIHLEKKNEETHRIHIPHIRIYKVLLSHGLVEINMTKRKQRK